MTIAEYLVDIAEDMRHKSDAIRRDFARHRPSAGSNREDLVEQFLIEHLPNRFGVSTGLIISYDGKFSNQADLVVVDNQNNAPLYPQSRNKLWPVESVYALIEVKTQLNQGELDDCIKKGQRFKSLKREFCDTGNTTRIKSSLFVIWAFSSSEPLTLKQTLLKALSDVPRDERPDLLVVPNRLVAQSGSYLELKKFGQPNSLFHQQAQARYGKDLSSHLYESVEMYDLSTNSLLVWYLWFDSWLRQAGPRFCDPLAYLPKDQIFGKKV